ncbi:uncharacterized protein V6R79_022671, partial [Siganus canaliculatus]
MCPPKRRNISFLPAALSSLRTQSHNVRIVWNEREKKKFLFTISKTQRSLQCTEVQYEKLTEAFGIFQQYAMEADCLCSLLSHGGLNGAEC